MFATGVQISFDEVIAVSGELVELIEQLMTLEFIKNLPERAEFSHLKLDRIIADSTL